MTIVNMRKCNLSLHSKFQPPILNLYFIQYEISCKEQIKLGKVFFFYLIVGVFDIFGAVSAKNAEPCQFKYSHATKLMSILFPDRLESHWIEGRTWIKGSEMS